MKTGKATIEAISVSCPECSECWFGADGGSSLISNNSTDPKAGDIATCEACRTRFKLPQILKKIGQ